MTRNKKHPMRSAFLSYCVSPFAAGCMLLCGCNDKPTEPGYEVIRPAYFVSPGAPRPGEVRIGSVIGSAGSPNSFVEWYVSTNTLAAQPHWDGVSKEAPLSSFKACELALSHVREHDPQAEGWLVETVFAINLYKGGASGNLYSYPDVWCYQITFTPKDPRDRARLEKEGGGYAMTQIVLLDGTVVEPTVVRRR